MSQFFCHTLLFFHHQIKIFFKILIILLLSFKLLFNILTFINPLLVLYQSSFLSDQQLQNFSLVLTLFCFLPLEEVFISILLNFFKFSLQCRQRLKQHLNLIYFLLYRVNFISFNYKSLQQIAQDRYQVYKDSGNFTFQYTQPAMNNNSTTNTSNENGQDRNLDPYNALEKVIRLDKKHTNFDYYDRHRNIAFRVTYPIPPFQTPNSQHLLKGFWRHVNNYYFKKIQQSELERIFYLEKLLLPLSQCDVRFIASPEFWYSVERIFSQDYYYRFEKSPEEELDCKNWLQSLYLVWSITGIRDKNPNKIINELKKVRNCHEILNYFESIQDQEKRFLKLISEETNLAKMLPDQQDLFDEVSEQIGKLEKVLEEECNQNQTLLNQLKQRVKRELNVQEITVIKYHEQEELQEVESVTELQKQKDKMFKTKRNIQRMQDAQIIKKYLSYSIDNLERKQIAQSISKVVKCQKGKGREQNHFTIEFQTGMNLKPIKMTEKQMKDLNQLRQYNLFKFYNTSLKTPFSFICQNYFGFKEIYDHRLKHCSLKGKDVLTEMKKTKIDFAQSTAGKAFSKFQICHHCKLLYPEDFLVKCQYSSSKNGAPITPSSHYDPYVSQILKLEQPKISNRFTGRRKNCYLAYTKKNQEYVCDRRFCKYCLRQNYEEGIDKNGLCPFCQGICFCTRCARADMVVRLKSIYLLLGGDVQALQEESYIDKVANWETQHETQGSRSLARGKIRPTKKPSTTPPAKMNQKMRNVRFQLEDLRILCDLVKRRQKQKQKLAQIRSEIFFKKVSILGKDLNIKANESLSSNTAMQEQKQEEKRQKMLKKLKRMI